MAAGLGAEVTIIDRSIIRLRELDELFEGRVRTRFSTIESVEEEVFAADVVIGADGVRSKARELVLGYVDKPKSSGYAVWRAW